MNNENYDGAEAKAAKAIPQKVSLVKPPKSLVR
jgi:hypothetical protein